MTLYQLLQEGCEELRLAKDTDAAEDARLLLLAAFELDTVHFLLNRMQELPDDEAAHASTKRYREMIARRRSRCPLQQILGSQEFMGLEFYVNQHVLIPRQDTEALVELVLEEQKDTGLRVLDLCTGSGCIAVSLAVKGRYQDITATDISEEALKVARRNVELHGCAGQIRLVQGDLFRALEQSGEPLEGQPREGVEGQPGEQSSAPTSHKSRPVFDIIASNPPYIPTAVIQTLEPEVREYEPLLALDGTEDGLLYYRRIVSEAKAYLAESGSLYLEIGHDQGEAVRDIFKAEGYQDIRVCKDLPGNDRVVCARR